MDCNLSTLCDNVQAEGFGSSGFSNAVVKAMGVTYRLHRLLISRNTYFRWASFSNIDAATEYLGFHILSMHQYVYWAAPCGCFSMSHPLPSASSTLYMRRLTPKS